MEKPAISGWARAMMAAEAVIERGLRATAALDRAGVQYMVIGGNAVAEWVARVDDGATRSTRDVDILIERTSFDAVREVLETIGFIHTVTDKYPGFIDGPDGRISNGIHVHYAGEPVKPNSDWCSLRSPNRNVAIHFKW